MAEKEYSFPVWGTQGGGLVKQVGNYFVFVEEPTCPGLKVGDRMPDEWGIAPANALARGEGDTKEGEESDFFDDFFPVMGDVDDDTEEGFDLEETDWPKRLKKEDLKAPAGKFRLVLTDSVPAITAVGSKPDYYFQGDFDTLEAAKAQSPKPECGTAYDVYDEAGQKVYSRPYAEI